MYFDSFAEFINMGGHGPYVWAAYGVTFVSFVIYLAAQRRARKEVERKIRNRIRRELNR
ncbi:MAG: heme exporter protein CcmD [Gammaproteobacteria bacterium]|jgi:heme exporter protein D|nr:heme exporter protein CcmD [Gammaproteobacteria bacterium]